MDYAYDRLKQNASLVSIESWRQDGTGAASNELATARFEVTPSSMAALGLQPKAKTNQQRPISGLPVHSTTLELTLCRPDSFMNLVGRPVAHALRSVQPDAYCVAHDGVCVYTCEWQCAHSAPPTADLSRRLGLCSLKVTGSAKYAARIIDDRILL